MQEAIKDFVNGGGTIINQKLGSVSYYKDEAYFRSKYFSSNDYSPKFLSNFEKKILEYLKAEKVKVGTSVKFPCEVISVGYNGFVAILIPEEALFEEDRLTRICALAHETGHYLDFKFNYDFSADHFDSSDDEEKKREKEVTAWKFAYHILKELGFDEWDRFLFEMKRALMTYFRFYEECLVDIHVKEISGMLIKTS